VRAARLVNRRRAGRNGRVAAGCRRVAAPRARHPHAPRADPAMSPTSPGRRSFDRGAPPRSGLGPDASNLRTAPACASAAKVWRRRTAATCTTVRADSLRSAASPGSARVRGPSMPDSTRPDQHGPPTQTRSDPRLMRRPCRTPSRRSCERSRRSRPRARRPRSRPPPPRCTDRLRAARAGRPDRSAHGRRAPSSRRGPRDATRPPVGCSRDQPTREARLLDRLQRARAPSGTGAGTPCTRARPARPASAGASVPTRACDTRSADPASTDMRAPAARTRCERLPSRRVEG
jgi:hypothetical protein